MRKRGETEPPSHRKFRVRGTCGTAPQRCEGHSPELGVLRASTDPGFLDKEGRAVWALSVRASQFQHSWYQSQIILCHGGCPGQWGMLATPLASTHQMPVMPPTQLGQKPAPDTAKCRTAPSEALPLQIKRSLRGMLTSHNSCTLFGY